MPREHGGNLDAAIARFGGERHAWLDLSTGINPAPYPVPALGSEVWAALPGKDAEARLIQSARRGYGTDAEISVFNGAQGAIQAIPRLFQPAEAAVVGPTYNEHSAALELAGWRVQEVSDVDAAMGSGLAVVVNPNNPDGRTWPRQELETLAADVGTLVIDESFVDPTPEMSMVSAVSDAKNLIVLRSFGKFYGLAGLRLGFAISGPAIAERLSDMAGPWPVAGPAIEIGTAALLDQDWQAATRRRLQVAATRLDRLAEAASWSLVGGTSLFRTYSVGDAERVKSRLAEQKILSRSFSYSESWLRLGLPPADRWDQLEEAFDALD